MRSRSPRASSASRSTCSSQPSSAGRCAGIRPSGRRQYEPADVSRRGDRSGDRSAGGDPPRVAGVDGAGPGPEVSAALDDPRRVPPDVALLAVRAARRPEPDQDRRRFRDRPRPRNPSRAPAGTVEVAPHPRDAAHRVVARDAAAGAHAYLHRPPPLDREPAEDRLHRLLLPVPDPAEHDRRRPRHRSDADGNGTLLWNARLRTYPAHRLSGGPAPDLRGDEDKSLAGGDHDGPDRVLLQHERRRLRPADLEEHAPACADVGRDRPDRGPRLPAEPAADPRGAPRPCLASRLAGGDGPVSTYAGQLLEVRNLAKTYGTGAKATQAIADVAFAVDDREFVCVVGPSGCGKTTLLKCVGGLLRPTSGQVLLRGKPVTSPPEEMALVFQEYGRSLMPWASVRNNVLLPLRHKKLARAERKALVEEALEAVGLTRFIDHHPWQLSGGMQQRVAIARALAYQPSILLMDEPFASVDAQTRGDLEDLILRVREEFAVTILFVTHDIDESVYLSDRVVVLKHAPTEVKEVIDVDLPFPRDQIATKELSEFTQLRGHVYRLIKREQEEPTRRLAPVTTATKGETA